MNQHTEVYVDFISDMTSCCCKYSQIDRYLAFTEIAQQLLQRMNPRDFSLHLFEVFTYSVKYLYIYYIDWHTVVYNNYME